MVVTGAGPGIMAAGLEGAGRDMSFGVTIRLPFEESVNEFIAGDPKLVSMKYFFTRKLALVKESSGFVCMPGGFGTLDETFELLTLQQTGKMAPVPIVLVDGARRHVLGPLGQVRARRADEPGTGFRRRRLPLPDHRRRLGGMCRDHRLLPRVPLGPLGGNRLVIRMRRDISRNA